MKRGTKSLVSRGFALAAILLSVGMIPPATTARTPASNNPAITPAAPEQGAQARIEVRLRKLHLVRPDLIPYPILYDVYC
jgi:hypothetical protein